MQGFPTPRGATTCAEDRTTGDLEDQERLLRIDQMTINIEKMRSDMRWETRQFVVSDIVATAAPGAGAAVGSCFARLPQPAPPQQTIIIQQQPYTPPAPPAAQPGE